MGTGGRRQAAGRRPAQRAWPEPVGVLMLRQGGLDVKPSAGYTNGDW